MAENDKSSVVRRVALVILLIGSVVFISIWNRSILSDNCSGGAGSWNCQVCNSFDNCVWLNKSNNPFPSYNVFSPQFACVSRKQQYTFPGIIRGATVIAASSCTGAPGCPLNLNRSSFEFLVRCP